MNNIELNATLNAHRTSLVLQIDGLQKQVDAIDTLLATLAQTVLVIHEPLPSLEPEQVEPADPEPEKSITPAPVYDAPQLAVPPITLKTVQPAPPLIMVRREPTDWELLAWPYIHDMLMRSEQHVSWNDIRVYLGRHPALMEGAVNGLLFAKLMKALTTNTAKRPQYLMYRQGGYNGQTHAGYDLTPAGRGNGTAPTTPPQPTPDKSPEKTGEGRQVTDAADPEMQTLPKTTTSASLWIVVEQLLTRSPPLSMKTLHSKLAGKGVEISPSNLTYHMKSYLADGSVERIRVGSGAVKVWHWFLTESKVRPVFLPEESTKTDKPKTNVVDLAASVKMLRGKLSRNG